MLVSARAREIAVRMALGASPSRTLRHTIIQGLLPVGLGTVAGLAVAIFLTSSARALLFGVDRLDLGSLAVGGAIVFAVTTLACVGPAVRASRTDPLSVLRAE